MEKEGEKVVEIPDEVMEKVNHLWEDYLIGKFLDTAPHVAKVHATVNRIWNQGDRKSLIDVHVVDETTMKFKVMDPGTRTRILKRGMWSIGNIPMVITKWIPDEMKEKPEITAIPLWVHLKNVPMNMYSWQGLSFIASAAGFPVRLHPETAACSNFKVAKIFVNADLTKELPTKINFTKNGVSSLVEFVYPWLPKRCNTCKKWGHIDKVCIMNKDDGGKSVKQLITEGIVGVRDSKEEMKQSEEESAKKKSKIAKSDKEIEEGELIDNWENVTPKKGNRSPILQFGQVRILTPSRFSALQEVDEEGVTGKQVVFEEILSVEEEIVTEDSELERITEAIKKKDDVNEANGRTNKGGDNSGMKDEMEISKTDQTVKVVAGIEHWPDLTTRPSLPRRSKTMHKVVPDKNMQESTPGKLDEEETCQHLFFSCKYSSMVWKEMVGGIMREAYTDRWVEILDVISQVGRDQTEIFIIRYAFQTLAHSIWRERNARKHGEQPMDEKTLAKIVDKMIRLKLLIIKGKGKKYLEVALMKWLATRQ
ncbi:hypothetical protein Bca4012_022969 [Brassica carinata]